MRVWPSRSKALDLRSSGATHHRFESYSTHYNLVSLHSSMFYCYIITNGFHTYNGYTNNLYRRLRQHNGILKGGARATRGKGPWKYVCILHCDSWTAAQAMSMEWHIKYPTNARPRPSIFQGPQGRLTSLPFAIKNSKAPNECYILFVDSLFQQFIPSFEHNVIILDINEIII